MWNVINPLRTEDKDLHPPAAELLGITLHWILRFAVCDDHQHFGEILPSAGRLGEGVFQEIVEGIAWSNETDRDEVTHDKKVSAYIVQV